MAFLSGAAAGIGIVFLGGVGGVLGMEGSYLLPFRPIPVDQVLGRPPSENEYLIAQVALVILSLGLLAFSSAVRAAPFTAMAGVLVGASSLLFVEVMIIASIIRRGFQGQW